MYKREPSPPLSETVPTWAEYDRTGTFGVLAFVCEHSSVPVDQYMVIERAGTVAALAHQRLRQCPYTRHATFIETGDGRSFSPMHVWAWGWSDASEDQGIARRARRA